MNGRLLYALLLFFFVGSIQSFRLNQNPDAYRETREDFKKYYDQMNVQGTFILYDQVNQKYVCYNDSLSRKPFTPASTFKICNTIIGLETGVIKDEHTVHKWDGVNRPNPAWNKDQDLKTAFQNSTVWYYQQLARKVGGKRMKYWLTKLQYGNADTSGGIDRFWLTGGLRISPEQQVEFLRKLNTNQLPVSQRTIDIVKKVMLMESTPDYELRSKTGWGMQDSANIGWYTGILEFRGKAYYFANCIQCKDLNNKDFSRARVDIVRQLFIDLEITQ